MGYISKNCYEYRHLSDWINEGAPWQPRDTITLRDEAGMAIGTTSMATMLMTIYNVETNTVIPGANGVDVKNARTCTLSPQGVFILKLLSADTVIIDSTRPYEVRRILVRFTWPLTPSKSDSLEITVVIRNIYMVP